MNLKPLTINKRARRRKVIFVLAAFVVLSSILAGYRWYNQQLQPLSSVDESQYVTIESGMSSTEIADLLQRESLIRNSLAFRLYARIEGISQGIQAGFYSLSPNQSPKEILTILTNGQTASITLRIPGGSELSQVAELFEEAGFSSEEVRTALSAEYDHDILRHKPAGSDLEGYLFADTYHIAADAQASDLVDMILTNTARQIDKDIVAAWEEMGMNIHEGLTLASIIEKEAPDPETQAKVSQVFNLRLQEDMMLQADPTYLYAARKLGRQASPQLDSPYNTYRNRGLPPGPIANVESGALQASANPSSGEYLYFVTGLDGVTRFSQTRQQHERYIDEHGISGT